MTEYQKLHRAENIPEHIFDQIIDLSDDIAAALKPVIHDKDANIVLAAINRFHAVLLSCSNTSEEGLALEAFALVENTKYFNQLKKENGDE